MLPIVDRMGLLKLTGAYRITGYNGKVNKIAVMTKSNSQIVNQNHGNATITNHSQTLVLRGWADAQDQPSSPSGCLRGRVVKAVRF